MTFIISEKNVSFTVFEIQPFLA